MFTSATFCALEQLMPTHLRVRFWIETAAACTAAILGIVTVFWRDWIETVFGVDPDHGNGSAEWIVVAVLFVLAAVLSVGARLEWRRAATTPA